MRKIIATSMMLLVLLILVIPTGASNIHMHYFESADAFLTDEQFQIFSFAALQGEKVTIVTYGLEEGMVPAITLFDTEGRTLVENGNLAGSAIAVVEVEISASGLYTFLVSRQNEVGGLVRVMLFEGDALEPDLSVLDTIDPLLPSRAYLIVGNDDEPVKMTLTVLDDDNAETPIPEVFASRATEITLPLDEERVTAITQNSWENDDGEIFYTLNVRPIPEPVPVSRKESGWLSWRNQFLDLTTLRLDLGAGSENPEFIPRQACGASVPTATALLNGPGDEYGESGTVLPAGTTVEIVFESGDYYLIVDLNNPAGGGWVPKSAVILAVERDGLQCGRVETIPAPPLPPVAQGDDGETPPPFEGLTPEGEFPGGTPGDEGTTDIGRDSGGATGGEGGDSSDGSLPSDDGGSDGGGIPPECVLIPPDDGGESGGDYGYGDYGYGDYGYGESGYGDYGYGDVPSFNETQSSSSAFGSGARGEEYDPLIAICYFPDKTCYVYQSGKVECYNTGDEGGLDNPQ